MLEGLPLELIFLKKFQIMDIQLLITGRINMIWQAEILSILLDDPDVLSNTANTRIATHFISEASI